MATHPIDPKRVKAAITMLVALRPVRALGIIKTAVMRAAAATGMVSQSKNIDLMCCIIPSQKAKKHKANSRKDERYPLIWR